MLDGSAARRLALGTLLSLVALGSAASASPSAPPRLDAQAPNVTFGLGPSTATAVDGRPYYNYAAAPGAVIHDHVAILNYSTQTLPLRLYAADGYNTYAGASNLRGADKPSTDLGAWVHLASRPGLLLVPGRTSQTKPPGRVIVPFTLVVPRKASVGDHVGGLVLALRTRGTNAQASRSASTSGSVCRSSPGSPVRCTRGCRWWASRRRTTTAGTRSAPVR
jgi:hypothetical protein